MFRSYLPDMARVTALLVLLLAGGSNAAEPPRFEVTPFAVYRGGGQFEDDNGGDLDLRSSAGGALAFNWRTGRPGAQYELLYSRQSTETTGLVPLDMSVEYLHIGGTTVIGEPGESRVEPFASGGLGATLMTPDAAQLDSATRPSLSLGGGVRIPFTEHVRLRLEARGYLTWVGGSTSIFCEGGCTIVAKGSVLFQYEALAGVSVSF